MDKLVKDETRIKEIWWWPVIEENGRRVVPTLFSKIRKCWWWTGPAVSALPRAFAEVKQRWSVIGWVTKNSLSRAPPCFGRYIKPLVHLQSLAPTNPHWARVVGYGPFSLCVIHKEGLCLNSRDMMIELYTLLLGSQEFESLTSHSTNIW
jgi:hypothetical protein